jgi:hypothetical protein
LQVILSHCALVVAVVAQVAQVLQSQQAAVAVE